MGDGSVGVKVFSWARFDSVRLGPVVTGWEAEVVDAAWRNRCQLYPGGTGASVGMSKTDHLIMGATTRMRWSNISHALRADTD